MTPASPRRIQSAENAFSIIQYLHEEGTATLSEIANHVGLSKGSVHIYIETLIHLDVLTKENDEYRVGLKLLEFGGEAQARREIYFASKPELQNLYEETGHTAQVAVEEHEDLVFLDRFNADVSAGPGSQVGPQGHIHRPRVGTRSHFHTPALGKAILAHLSERKVELILSKHGLPEITEHSITTRDALREELSQIREQGYAVNDEEVENNYKGIARPIMVNDDVRGSISVSGPKTDLSLKEEPIHDLLQSAVDRIEIKLAVE